MPPLVRFRVIVILLQSYNNPIWYVMELKKCRAKHGLVQPLNPADFTAAFQASAKPLISDVRLKNNR